MAIVGPRIPGLIGALSVPWLPGLARGGDLDVPLLIPTAIQTSNYHARVGELVIVDASRAPLTVYLPAGGTRGAVCGVKIFGALQDALVVSVAPAQGSGEVVDGDSEPDALTTTNESAIYVCSTAEGTPAWWRVS